VLQLERAAAADGAVTAALPAAGGAR